jgi:hypothetical protein
MTILEGLNIIENIKLQSLLHDFSKFNIYIYIQIKCYPVKDGFMGYLYRYIQNKEDHNYLFTQDGITKELEKINIDMYTKIYPELQYQKDITIYKHYIDYNHGKSYFLPDNFNIDIYKYLYDDLSTYDEEQLKIHYILHGCQERRFYSMLSDFNPDLYKSIYPDLANEIDLWKHYVNYGIHEKRIYKLPDDFNPVLYQQIYTDLEYMTRNQLIHHYLMHGHKENRIYKL